MAKLSVDKALLKAKSHAKKGEIEEAQKLYQAVLQAFPKNKRAQQGLAALSKPKQPAATQGPPQETINQLLNLYNQGQLTTAIEQANTLTAQYPETFIVWNILGAAHNGLGETFEASEAFKKVTVLNPNYADGFNNLGVTLKEQGKLEEAIEAYNKALAIKPDYAESHRNLSTIKKYNPDTAQISEVEALLQRTGLNDSDRCNLLYTHAKMQEDLGDLSDAFDSYVAGGDLRQKLLAYNFSRDEYLFDQIKRTAPKFKNVALNAASEPITHTPIFILGMPRSGTTLVEQIISSHSEVTGAGELEYVSRFGAKLVTGLTSPTLEAVSVFRDHYLAELAERAEGQAFITDKIPQNFQYIALICAAFPEARIVHVQRNAEATCWSNFKHYFSSKNLGYSYNLLDTVRYYGLYKDLMHFWSQSYSDRIYNLDYDKLTEDQEAETRRLIAYLGLKWEDACLAPQNNKRSVKTASQQQVRQKVYKGSSQAWRKYEPFLDGVFDELDA